MNLKILKSFKAVDWRSHLAAFGLSLVYIYYAWVAWDGYLPFGNDSFEYLGVAESLFCTGRPIVAGVERAIRPLFYPILLGTLGKLGLPMAPTGLFVNYIIVLVLGLWLVYRERKAPWVGFASGIFLITSQIVWELTSTVMTDIIFLGILTWLLFRSDRISRYVDVLSITVASLALTGLRSLGIVVAAACSIHLYFKGIATVRKYSWLPLGTSILLYSLQAAFLGLYPHSMIEYGFVLRLRDPFDFSQGYASLVEILARFWHRQNISWHDFSVVTVGHFPGIIPLFILIIIIVSAWFFLSKIRVLVATFSVLYFTIMVLWPFRITRFWAPFLAIVIILLHHALLRVEKVPKVWNAVIIIFLLIILFIRDFYEIRYIKWYHDYRLDRAQTLYTDFARLKVWLDENVPAEERIQSPDYHSLALLLGKAIAPMGYTNNPEQMMELVLGWHPRWYIYSTRIYPLRGKQSEALIQRFPENFILRYESSAFRVYEVTALDPNAKGRPSFFEDSSNIQTFPVRHCLPLGIRSGRIFD